MSSPDISVIFSTYNRAAMLRQTLEAMSVVDREDITVEFVVVDNNSKDNTGEVIDSFKDRLPLTHLFEARPGKNCALNLALSTVELGELVVFTDDDIVPAADWLHKIIAGSKRWPDSAVFGGRIDPIWPEGAELPCWVQEVEWLRSVVFSVQDLGAVDIPYEENLPFGPNFWVRKAVFEAGRRYDESVGPRPGSYRMGSETSFLLQLVADGFEPMYVHDSMVGHHAQPEFLSDEGLVNRLIRSGRGLLSQKGINREELLAASRTRWYFRTWVAVAVSRVRILVNRTLPRNSERAERMALAARWLGYDLESLAEVKFKEK